MNEMIEERYVRIAGHFPHQVGTIGEAIENGITQQAADELGLLVHTPISIGIIDAHAGGIGMLGIPISSENAHSKPLEMEDLCRRLALISGTSSCHMIVHKNPIFCPGIWGPYYSAMIPNMWLTEGGETACGSLLDHIIMSHIGFHQLKMKSLEESKTVYEILNGKLMEMATTYLSRIKKSSVDIQSASSLLVPDVHVLPYFHGNRSPHADPTLKGSIVGLDLDNSVNNLSLLYLATIQAIAYGTKHVIQELNRKGYQIDTIYMSGGLSKNSLFVQQHADILECRIVLPEEDAVSLGSAILAAVSSKYFENLILAMSSMSRAGSIILPTEDPALKLFHKNKFKVFLMMYEDQISYRRQMLDNS